MHDRVGVDGPAAVPVAAGPEDGVRRVAREAEPVGRPRVADGVLPPVAVGLIEQVDLVAEHDGPRSTEAVLLGLARVCEFTGLLPVQQIVARGDADAPAFARFALVVGQRVVEPIAALKLHYRRILGEGPPGDVVGEVHAGLFGGGTQRAREKDQSCQLRRESRSHEMNTPSQRRRSETPSYGAARILMGMAGAVRVAVSLPVDIVPLRITLTFQPAGACFGDGQRDRHFVLVGGDGDRSSRRCPPGRRRRRG